MKSSYWAKLYMKDQVPESAAAAAAPAKLSPEMAKLATIENRLGAIEKEFGIKN